MKTLPIVAIIGQTNAGKSTLLNRLARRNVAITAREEGTTRDNVVAKVDDHFLMIDTAGLKDPADDFEASIQDQIADAIGAANLILVLIDGTKYPDDKTTRIVRLAQKSKKPYLIVLNKSDLRETLKDTEFRHFGEKELHRISATTGQGTNELKELIEAQLVLDPSQTTQERDTETPLRIALIGRPNVGKSSLFNTLGSKQQAIVSSHQGTTRDINRMEVKYHGRTIEILDTAGLRRPGKREVGIEKFSAIRTIAAIEESDICCLLIDSTEPRAKLDQALAGQIADAGKGIILVVTKTDLDCDADKILSGLRFDFNFTPYAPVVLTSSETGKNVAKIFELSTEIDTRRYQQIKTSDLNKVLNEAIIHHPPAGLKNTMPKPKYVTQTDVAPPWFVVHGHELQLLHWSYKRYLERTFREHFDFAGTPIKFSFISTK
jgi:GTP-binding protein